jgi:putative transposase
MGISEATYFNWKKKYGSLGVPEQRKFGQFDEENFRLKQIIAYPSLDKQMLLNLLIKTLKPTPSRGLAQSLIDYYKVSIGKPACITSFTCIVII